MKDAYYFSHDSNASNDPKIIAMRSVYGTEGYGRYWLLVEMLREADGYRLETRGKYAFNAYAEHLKCDCNAFASYLHDCIHEFQLFSSDDSYFWSESLMRRMQKANEKSEKARLSAEARWNKKPKNADASKSNANAKKIDAIKESKVNEIKGNEIDQVHVPVFDNPLNNQIEEWLKKYKVEYLIKNLEDISSFIGVVETEVIQYAIGESEGKTGAYPVTILNRLVREGKTTIEKVNPKPKAGEQSEKHEGESRHERHSPEDKPITGGAVGWLPSAAQRSANVIPLRDMSG